MASSKGPVPAHIWEPGYALGFKGNQAIDPSVNLEIPYTVAVLFLSMSIVKGVA